MAVLTLGTLLGIDSNMRKVSPLVDPDKYMPNTRSVSNRPNDFIGPEYVVGHTTGSGIVAKAKVNGRKFDDHSMVDKLKIIKSPELSGQIVKYAAEYYANSRHSSTQYIIGYYGELFCTADEDKRVWSAGIKRHRLDAYSKGLRTGHSLGTSKVGWFQQSFIATSFGRMTTRLL